MNRLVQAQTALDLVQEIARKSPITITGDEGQINVCKFCEVYWAERNYNEWLGNHPRWLELQAMTNAERLATYLASSYGKPDHWLAVGEHHEPDCLWIRANQLIND